MKTAKPFINLGPNNHSKIPSDMLLHRHFHILQVAQVKKGQQKLP